jgi:hypothetical protein
MNVEKPETEHQKRMRLLSEEHKERMAALNLSTARLDKQIDDVKILLGVLSERILGKDPPQELEKPKPHLRLIIDD